MVIGAIEIDGTYRLARGSRAVPMEMHWVLGRARDSAGWLLSRIGPPGGPVAPVAPAHSSVGGKVPRWVSPRKLLTCSL